MKYLCLIYGDEQRRMTASKEEAAAMWNAYMAFGEDIQKSGHGLGGAALEPTSATTVVRVRDGKLSTTDGPFIETKEQLGGYYLIEAKDLNEAIQIAGRIPGAKVGAIEVRPIRGM